MFSIKKIISAAAMGLLLVSGANAGTLYSSGPTGGDSGWCVGDFQCGGSFEIVTPISLASASSLSSVNFTIGNFTGFSSTGTVYVNIWNAAPTVGTWASASVFSGNQSATLTDHLVTVSLSNESLAAGQYWIGLMVTKDTDVSTYLVSTDAGKSEQFDVDPTTFSAIRDNATVPLMALEVNGVSAVPEPTGLALMLAGLGLTGLVVRRKAK